MPTSNLDKWLKEFAEQIPLKTVKVGENLWAEKCVVDREVLKTFLIRAMREYAISQLERVNVVREEKIGPVTVTFTCSDEDWAAKRDEIIKENQV